MKIKAKVKLNVSLAIETGKGINIDTEHELSVENNDLVKLSNEEFTVLAHQSLPSLCLSHIGIDMESGRLCAFDPKEEAPAVFFPLVNMDFETLQPKEGEQTSIKAEDDKKESPGIIE
jgi:hypothetical protein